MITIILVLQSGDLGIFKFIKSFKIQQKKHTSPVAADFHEKTTSVSCFSQISSNF